MLQGFYMYCAVETKISSYTPELIIFDIYSYHCLKFAGTIPASLRKVAEDNMRNCSKVLCICNTLLALLFQPNKQKQSAYTLRAKGEHLPEFISMSSKPLEEL